MKKIMIPFLFVLCFGCEEIYEFDKVVLDNLEEVITIESDCFQLDIYLEKKEDINISTLTTDELIRAIEFVYKETNNKSLQHIALWIPYNESTWIKIRPDSKAATHTVDTDLAYHLIGINPDRWQYESKNILLDDWIHELTHAAFIDPNHERNELWSDGGFVDQIKNDVMK